MSEQTQTSQNTIVIALVVIAVLLAAIVGVLVYQRSQAIPAPTITGTGATGQTGATTDSGASGMPGGAPAGMGGNASSAPTEFDAKTATKVPAGMTPEQMIKTYHEDVIAGKFEESYSMLPLDKQQSYGDAKAYGDQVKAYGITGYEAAEPVEDGDTVTIAATMQTPQMPIAYTWTFKKVGDQWYVVSRTMGGQ